jgi:hypothetical protein
MVQAFKHRRIRKTHMNNRNNNPQIRAKSKDVNVQRKTMALMMGFDINEDKKFNQILNYEIFDKYDECGLASQGYMNYLNDLENLCKKLLEEYTEKKARIVAMKE